MSQLQLLTKLNQVLIEKLLYSCPQVEKIYLLIREAKGKSPHERMMKMIGAKPFTIRLKQDFILSKLVAINSDLAEARLGLNDDDFKLLAERVSIIFHVAASVKFEAPLEINMRHNVVATKELLELACNFDKLQCFVHVSTAYSNCQLRQIDERVYPMEVPEDPMAYRVSKEMLDNRPNTYTYTKAMAENVASQYSDRINVVIVRPSIVMSALKEPDEGWVDTINGPVGLSVLGALGILQTIKVNSEVVFDLIPVDIVTNALLSIAWAATSRRSEFNPDRVLDGDANNNSLCDSKSITTNNPGQSDPSRSTGKDHSSGTTKLTSTKKESNNLIKHLSKSSLKSNATGVINEQEKESSAQADGSVRVFNLTTGAENPCSFYQYFSTGREEAYNKPSSRALRPLLKIPKQKGMNPIQYWIHKIFSHLLFAYIADSLLYLFGQKRLVVKAVNRMHHANEVFDYFCSNQWTFSTENVQKMRELQRGLDKELFNCDVRAINWKTYAQIGWLGCRRFILNEDDESFEYSKRRYRAICLMYYVVKLILVLSITSLVKCYVSSSTIVASVILLPIYGVVYLL